ncbi:MAG TPA: hypothetical protein DD412_02630 [Holosporales bacterium]|nr:hypothetical protein [Holosporales bacterium]
MTFSRGFFLGPASDNVDEDPSAPASKELMAKTTLLEAPHTLEAIHYVLAALNGMTFNIHQSATLDLEHHLKMCETLVKLTQHFKETT